MSSDLLELASDIASRAVPGEQLEAYVSRTRETDVKVFDHAVESLTVAERAGVGVRVIVAQDPAEVFYDDEQDTGAELGAAQVKTSAKKTDDPNNGVKVKKMPLPGKK